MKHKPVIPRTQADRDIREAVEYYLNKGGEQSTLALVHALEQAFLHIGRYPASGSTRYAYELGLPSLRCWLAKRYPYLVFYAERDDHIDVWRVLHGQRDIPAWLSESD